MMNKEKKCVLVFSITLIFLLFQSGDCIAQSLTGTTGLVTIPTAEMPEDGEISFGLSRINKYCFIWGDNYDGTAQFVTLGYLPFLEISLRLTKALDFPEPQALGDRMTSVRLRPLEEGKFFPSVVLGAHGLGTSSYFNSLYLATSKGFRLSFFNRIEFHLGYGTDWMKEIDWIDVKGSQFLGLFGGISLSPREFITLMLEHDAEKFNCGMQVTILGHLELLVALLDFDTFSGGIRYKFGLD